MIISFGFNGMLHLLSCGFGPNFIAIDYKYPVVLFEFKHFLSGQSMDWSVNILEFQGLENYFWIIDGFDYFYGLVGRSGVKNDHFVYVINDRCDGKPHPLFFVLNYHVGGDPHEVLLRSR